MRRILLASTAVIGAALLAPTGAEAQEAPTVRIGGYFRAYYGYTQQNGNRAVNTSMNQVSTDAASNPPNALASAALGHNDFSTDAEVHVFVNGKTANGLSYGAVIEIQFDAAEGSTSADARRYVAKKTTASIDEMYAFIASPTLGQLRFGDEDGPFGGLMNVGWITNFGTGGIFGEWESFMVRPNRALTTPGGVGDNTKIIYLSPQFFGFDFGVSFALNEGEGEDTGCLNSFTSINCDRAYAVTNIAGNVRVRDMPGRLNEIQYAIRWRGNVVGIGLAAGFSGMTAQVVRNMTSAGVITRNLRNPEVYNVGAQATWMGLTVGGNYMWGNTSFFFIPSARGYEPMEQYSFGASYTFGPFSVGANMFAGQYPGTGAPLPGRNNRRYGYGIGANYRLAPGLDLVAEYVRHEVHQPDNANTLGLANYLGTDRAKGSVFLTGVRLAF